LRWSAKPCVVLEENDPDLAGLLATSLVADIQLISASIVWGISIYVANNGIADSAQIIVSLSGGALLANFVSVILFMGDTLKSKR